MSIYRFYKLSSGKRIAAPAEVRDFVDDIPAFEHARRLANGHAIGVWQGARFVANVESNDLGTSGEHFTARCAS